MLGPPKARDLGRSVLMSLESAVPPNHFYRHLERTLDLAFVRDLAADCYARGGRPSVDPVVFFKLHLIMFFEGLRSERKLIEIASLNLAHRWYLGYNLDEPLPDHSSLSKIRARLGLSVFRRFFNAIVTQCAQAGLVWGKELIFDATKVRANASMDSLTPVLRLVVDDHLAALVQAESPEEAPPWDVLEQCRLDPDRLLTLYYERKSDQWTSSTNPDAALIKPQGAQACLGYQDHYVVDGGKARIILHALVTPGDVMENQPMLDLLRRVMTRWRLRPKRVIADTTYGTIDNIRVLEGEEHICAYVPLPDWEHKTAYYGPGQFRYDAVQNVYVCPQGALLHPYRQEWKAEKTEYRADAAVCHVCPRKKDCTPSNHGRQVHRSFHAEYLDRVRGYHETEEYQKAMRKRKVWIEPLFGEAKQWHGMRQFRLGFAEGEHGGAVDRGGTEPEAIAERTGLGTTPLAGWNSWSHVSEGAYLLCTKMRVNSTGHSGA